QRAICFEYSSHLGYKPAWVRSMLEDLDAEHRIERAVLERQPIATIEIIGTRNIEIRSCRPKHRLVLDTDIFIDVRPKDPLELFVSASHVEQRSTGSWSHCLEHAHQERPLEIYPVRGVPHCLPQRSDHVRDSVHPYFPRQGHLLKAIRCRL